MVPMCQLGDILGRLSSFETTATQITQETQLFQENLHLGQTLLVAF